GWTSFLAEDAQRFSITIASLEQGFALTKPALTVLTERELYGERVRSERDRKRRRGTARDPEAIIRDLTELTIGAPIVHVDHGVGRYQGLLSMDVGGMDGEFLTIEYAKGDKLYVPVSQLGLVSRYSGTAPELAPLHSLGGDAWERARKKAAEKVRDVAAELLAIYAQREARGGESMPIDRQLVEEFGSTFPFEETPDQETAIEAVLADLAAPRAMDRVICGDVGFGKTEVALRAAFAAATAGRQVAVLVPTTLLAQQHYRNFADRFADWPVRVDVLSRFKSTREVNEALKRLADGQIDVIVGTHKLLQSDIKFKNLGLVIVDEEQRFGVRQKEQLKKLRAEVDLLTMTATPIPRTLNMAMAGLRDLSLIATPPAHRSAVRTFISAWDPATIREALQRELSRGGQVYFLHNEVLSIERTVRELEELVPEARIRIAHGQMPERELEGVMADFHRQRFNVLVCTTIIETGIDIPTANTIIINRADRFGLAQLHQLRGRVGRSHHRAYAYLVVPDRKSITADAQKRLEALASLEELGAGFTLATHDLEIRGAGELLGDEQSGQIQEIGFGLYTELLDRAVRALKSGKIPDFDLSSEHETEVELHQPALRGRSARPAGGDDRPLRPAAGQHQATVRGGQPETDGHPARHPQTGLRRQRRADHLPREARSRSAGDHQADPGPAPRVQARWPGQAEGDSRPARRQRAHPQCTGSAALAGCAPPAMKPRPAGPAAADTPECRTPDRERVTASVRFGPFRARRCPGDPRHSRQIRDFRPLAPWCCPMGALARPVLDLCQTDRAALPVGKSCCLAAAPPDCACTSSKCEGQVMRRMSWIAPWIPERVWHHRESQMEKQITSPPRDRLWRRAGGFVFALLFCWLGVAHAAGMPLNGAWGEVGPGDTPQSVLEAYRSGHLNSFDPSMLQQFPRSKRGNWVVIVAQPPWDNEERVLTVYPPPMGTISVTDGGQKHALAIDDFSAPLHGHGRLAWRVPATLPASAPILLRLEPGETLSAPIRFRILPWGDYLQRDAQWLVFASACFAVMLAMVLMALFFSLVL